MKVSSSSGRVCGGGGGVYDSGGGDGNDAGSRGDGGGGGGGGGGAPINSSSPPCSDSGDGGVDSVRGGDGGLVAGVLVSDQGEVISDRYVGVARRQFASRQASERGSTKADQSDSSDDETTLRQMLVR
ncbi:keratin, type II cytoskeletal 2 epidermal-like [Sipha flava]|uniref:Keratin, type II cytoskeletal 2 epidermal-like n=2 Tax=Sipha flava TaxID=143950 RepID=A0A8B8GBC2_9HEMI|nr:keratin, type II cytoskeletal 2 epidermal-like [Sipha flava]XP_025420518.1 keratin, type II cytoskeletal 2 epidermal-like [Sipha flava]XP_025420519.1 keratin, type II cytoskeletal 2 epidermal-like [Sipha flava]